MNDGSLIFVLNFIPNRVDLNAAFREATTPLAAQKTSKLVGDCFLLAYVNKIIARLVTFDKGLLEFARKQGYPAFSPA